MASRSVCFVPRNFDFDSPVGNRNEHGTGTKKAKFDYFSRLLVFASFSSLLRKPPEGRQAKRHKYCSVT